MTRTARTLLLLLVLGALAGPGIADDDPAADRVPLESFFKGKVVSVEGSRIELFYDFEDPAQLRDFEASIPFRAIQNIKFTPDRGRIRVKGTGSMRHRAVFRESIALSAEFRAVTPKDFGFAVTEARESEVFTLYCLYDKYFSAGDGVFTNQNMIIKFIPRDPKVNKDGVQDWRYCGSRGPKPEIKRGKPVRVSIERGDNKSLMTIGEKWSAKGKEAGRDLTSQMGAIYGYKCDVRVDDLTVAGELDPAFIEEHRFDMTERGVKKAAKEPEVDAAEPPPPEDEAARVRAKIAGYPAKTKPPRLAKMLRDDDIHKSLRREAAQKAIDSGDKRIVPFLLNGLGSSDAFVRQVSFEVFKSLTGKNFGYRPDAPDGARSGAMKKINQYVAKKAAEFQ